MRSRSKFGFAAGVILATTLGFACLGKAAPLVGFTAAVPAVQITRDTSASEALPEKAYYRRYYHRPYYHRPPIIIVPIIIVTITIAAITESSTLY